LLIARLDEGARRAVAGLLVEDGGEQAGGLIPILLPDADGQTEGQFAAQRLRA